MANLAFLKVLLLFNKQQRSKAEPKKSKKKKKKKSLPPWAILSRVFLSQSAISEDMKKWGYWTETRHNIFRVEMSG